MPKSCISQALARLILPSYSHSDDCPSDRTLCPALCIHRVVELAYATGHPYRRGSLRDPRRKGLILVSVYRPVSGRRDVRLTKNVRQLKYMEPIVRILPCAVHNNGLAERGTVLQQCVAAAV